MDRPLAVGPRVGDGIAVVLIASPLTVWVLARIMWPDFGQNSSPRQRWLIVGVA